MPKPTDNRVAFRFTRLKFSTFGDQQESIAEFNGWAQVGRYFSGFTLKISPLYNGEWQGRTLDWAVLPSQPPVLRSDAFKRDLINRAARLLDTTNCWPTSQEA